MQLEVHVPCNDDPSWCPAYIYAGDILEIDGGKYVVARVDERRMGLIRLGYDANRWCDPIPVGGCGGDHFRITSAEAGRHIGPWPWRFVGSLRHDRKFE